MNNYSFVNVNEFTPNNGGWTEVGSVDSYTQNGTSLQLNMVGGEPGPIVYFYSPSLFRVRFNSAANYTTDNSYAVVNRDFGFNVSGMTVTDTGSALEIQTSALRVVINKAPYGISVYQGGQLIHADTSEYNLVYDNQCVANFKVYPANAYYFGFGEKAGSTLAKNQYTMTFFNFDNFEYSSGPLPEGEQGGPLNPSETLYNSTPLLIETNPNPDGQYQGPPYSYGIFFDNPCQTFMNIGASDYSEMYGKYYFGALYGDLDYYFMAGQSVPQVIDQYTQLTGRAPMPPKYVFGYHQGCYGYYNRFLLEQAANAYRAARIPIDGLHIDVDFQNNYRTFTSSEMKFPNVQEMFADLHEIGFKCSTNITSLVTANPYDETGQQDQVGVAGHDSYPARLSGLQQNAFLYDTVANSGEDPDHFIGDESYGTDFGTNPYPYPPLKPNEQDQTQLGSYGFYPDFGQPSVQKWWGQQYEYLLSVGLDMIWQDMTCPALVPSADNDTPYKTFPLDLMQSSFGGYQPNAVVHNAYALLLIQSTYNGVNQLRPGLRNFIIARGGYAGMHRYAGLWTGDSASSWDFLQINIPEVLNIGLSGQPISGCDIGGFAVGSGSTGNFYVDDEKAYGNITNYELFTRWMQLGAFLPWYRNHYDGYVKQFQEPYQYGEPVPTNCRKYIEIRYRLIQVFYDAMYQASQTGMPIARPLFLNFPNDLTAYGHLDDQFFLGDSILVAPIIQQHETANPPTQPLRDVYLPNAPDVQWYAFQNNEAPLSAPVNGGTLVQNYDAPLSLVPIYIRAGAILPMRGLEQYIGELPENPITFDVYPGADSTYLLYLDDGLTTKAQTDQEYRLTEITHTGITGGQRIRIQRLFDNYAPPEKFYNIALLGTDQPTQVTADGVTLQNLVQDTDQQAAEALAESPINAYYYNGDLKTTVIKIFDNSPDITVQAVF
jgi:alpha-glucosidase